jgi:hypothetical protein
MPTIVIKDYQWRQTEKKIIIHVPLKGRPRKVDLFVMDNYAKVRSLFFFQNNSLIYKLEKGIEYHFSLL